MDLTHGKSLSYQQFINIGLLITSGKSKKKRRRWDASCVQISFELKLLGCISLFLVCNPRV